MSYLSNWQAVAAKSRFWHFWDIILKGYGQVLVCLNPVSGLFLAIAIFCLSWEIGLLTLAGVISSTITASIIRARQLHIDSGVYGFNGVVLGIAWLWFLKLTLASVILLIIATVASSLLIKVFINFSSRTRINPPFFSLPALILIWLLVVISQQFLSTAGFIGPDQRIIDYLLANKVNFAGLSSHFTLNGFLKNYYKQLSIAIIILLGIRVHSAIAARVSIVTFLITVPIVYCLGWAPELLNLEFYLYNAVPCSIAVGGTFLAFNRRVFICTIICVICVIGSTFIGLRYFVLPVFVAPFNAFSILFIWLVKSGILKRSQGFFAIPMEFVSTPEFGLNWHKGEIYADNYWRQIKDSFK